MKIDKGRKNSAGFALATLAITVFSLMLASQVIGYAGPGSVLATMFPAAAFGGNFSSAHSTANQVQQNPVQNIGSPLPPGTISYDNTWNNSQSLVCKTQSVPSAPLSTVTANSWTSTINIPEELS